MSTMWVGQKGPAGSHGGVALPRAKEHPGFVWEGQLVDRQDAYFGCLATPLGSDVSWIWHCSSYSRVGLQRSERGMNIQMVRMQTLSGESASSHAPVEDYEIQFPTRMALGRDQGAHNMCLTDACTSSRLADLLGDPNPSGDDQGGQKRILAYGVGGQYDAEGRGFKFGVHLYSLEMLIYASGPSDNYYFNSRMLLVTGHHPGCIELRSKCKGVGEFDGQSLLIYFKDQWFLYARANCGEKGYRQVQVCQGAELDNLGPFKYVSIAGVALDADVYLAHVYSTEHGTLVAILPMAVPPGARYPTQGGIYIAESVDGIDFGPPVLLRHSSVYQRRTADMPVHFPSLRLRRGSDIVFPLHLGVRARMSSEIPGNERIAWWSWSWPQSLRTPTNQEIEAGSIKRQRLAERVAKAVSPRPRHALPASSSAGLSPAADLEQIHQNPPQAMEDATILEIYRSWETRSAGQVDVLSQTEFEDWVYDNQPWFGRMDVPLNLDLVKNFFERRKEASRVPTAKPMPIGERIAKGSEYFNKEHFKKFTPKEGDRLALFLSLLHANLPMHEVAQVWSKEHQLWKTPNNATEFGFIRAYQSKFNPLLGTAPTLWTYQKQTDIFLRKWCPPGKKNLFKWDHVAGGHSLWTLSGQECSEIAYVTTYQYGCAVLQHSLITE